MHERYAARRRRLMEESQGDLILVRGAGPDGVNANFVYLTGIEESRAALLLAPDGTRFGTGARYPGPDYVRGRRVRQVLFLPPADPLAARWGESGPATADATTPDAAGVDVVLPIGELPSMLTQSLKSARRMIYLRGYAPSLGGADDPDSEFLGPIRRRFLRVEVEDGTHRVEHMRSVKDDLEVAAMERAAGVTAEAVAAVMREARAGMRECELEARIAAIYRRHGATHAFEPIVGAGANALKLHYTENTATISAGDLVLVDTGARLAGYCADVTRTFPVDGRFGNRQREVYQVVLDALETTTKMCRPGVLLGDLHAAAWDVIERAGMAEGFVHGLGHHLGIEVHDVGNVHRPLDVGAVITIEPGIYLTSEGIGVRIEDDVLITREGHRVLTAAIPRTVEKIEAALAEGR